MINTKRVVFRLAGLMVILALASCSTPKLATTMEVVNKASYTLSENYANHRAHQHLLKVGDYEIAYLDLKASDSAPVLVLLHGVPSSSWLYRKMLPELQNSFRVVAIDLLGYGTSAKPKSNGSTYSREAQADYVQAVLNHLDVDQYQLAFHDMGGLVAWELVERDLLGPKAIQTLFVLNTIISEIGFNHPKVKKGVMARTMSNAFSNAATSAAALELTFNNMGLSSNADLSEKECFGYVAPMREGSSDALYEFYTGFDEALFARLSDQIMALEGFQGEVHVFWGAQDKVLTTEQLPVLESALNQAQVFKTIYENQSHFLPEEIPLKLAAAFKQTQQ